MSHKSKCIASFATAAVLLFSTVFANDYSGVKTPVTDAAESFSNLRRQNRKVRNTDLTM